MYISALPFLNFDKDLFMSPINHNFVISMPSANQRRAHIEQEFSKQNIPFQFFDALTPSSNLNQLIEQLLPNLNNSKLTAGEKGCLMSHFVLWQKCIQDNLDYICLFEDDILLGNNALAFLANNLWLKERFNFQQNFILRLETFLMPVETLNTEITEYKARKFEKLISPHFGTAGYIISNSSAKYLTDFFCSLSSEQIQPIDELIFNQLLNLDNYIVYQLNPAICVQELQFNKENSALKSALEKERKEIQDYYKNLAKKQRTLKQRLLRVKENIIRAFSKGKRKEDKPVIKFL